MLTFESVVDQLQQRLRPVNEDQAEVLLADEAVEIISATPTLLRAGVEDDGNRYLVTISWVGYHVNINCSCGAIAGHVCPHAWAAAVTAENDGIFDDMEDDDSRTYSVVKQMAQALQPKANAKPQPEPQWKRDLAAMHRYVPSSEEPADKWPQTREVLYVIDRDKTMNGKGVVVETVSRERKKTGDWTKPKNLSIRRSKIQELPRDDDRVIVAALCGAPSQDYGYYDYDYGRSSFVLDENIARTVLPLMGRTGRLMLRNHTHKPEELININWGSDIPWLFNIDVELDPAKQEYAVRGFLERDGERRPISQPRLLTKGGLVFWDETIEPLDDGDVFHWIIHLRGRSEMRIPQSAGKEFSRELYRIGARPRIRMPEEIKVEEVRAPLQLYLKLLAPKKSGYDNDLVAQLEFDYQGSRVNSNAHGAAILVEDKAILRDNEAESQAMGRLHQLGFRERYSYDYGTRRLVLPPSKLAKVVITLTREGWHVEAEGKLYRQAGEFNIEVTSGIDWFELHGKVQFGDQVATLPQLLAALRKGDSFVQLGDGTVGMLPDEWLKKYGMLAGMGKEDGDHLKFARAQVGLLDALLAAQPEARCDEVFEKTRQMMRSFEGIAPLKPHSKFKGTLRPYQAEGLGWLKFLRDFSFGGCLADDMGLGKTVQVLAMLQARKLENASSLPSLIVVPRSLVFNWSSEAAKFAPELRVLDHSHAARTKAGDHFVNYDIVLTTYGTLRRDAAYLKDVEFDHVILDEAQAIKNAASESAKAARLLKARHRLALSGTPVQNHLGDLWSLFEFLNPGMLGTSSVLTGAASMTKVVDDDTKRMLAMALRPFILRRTKEQVAKDLPEKLEQTIYCELDSKQRKAYNELKEYYRANLLELVATQGMNKAKIQILEALLRLRQAACHPGLIDKSKTGADSAKLDMLLERLEEITEEGHKTLVFSQFTSFLDIVRKRLDKLKIKYEYLDGKTKDRQARVDRFQKSDKAKIFLISLKAGGVGLNLTSADYVFLLDPWWNPAVEAQAIDRTHRIGQTKKVYACRLIAKDTVEEKVLQLQQTKKDLADAIINADNSVISTLGKAELELLLS